MRSLYRTVSLAQERIVEWAGPLADLLNQLVTQALLEEKTTSSPNYLYVLFETIAQLLKLCKGTQVFLDIEKRLIGALNKTITDNMTDMNVYAFQIYSIFVANSTTASNDYIALT